MRLADCRVYKGHLRNEWAITPFRKHPKSSKFVCINSSLQFRHISYISFKNVLSLTIEYRMYLKFLQKPRCLGWLNKVKFLKRQFQSKKLLFVHKKETERSFELSLSIGVFYRCIFNLEMQNFSLENHHMMNAHQPFCWWMIFTKVSYQFLPPSGWPFDFCGRGGVWVI